MEMRRKRLGSSLMCTFSFSLFGIYQSWGDAHVFAHVRSECVSSCMWVCFVRVCRRKQVSNLKDVKQELTFVNAEYLGELFSALRTRSTRWTTRLWRRCSTCALDDTQRRSVLLPLFSASLFKKKKCLHSLYLICILHTGINLSCRSLELCILERTWASKAEQPRDERENRLLGNGAETYRRLVINAPCSSPAGHNSKVSGSKTLQF